MPLTGSSRRPPDAHRPVLPGKRLCNAGFRHDPNVLARATSPRYTNYTFVSSYGAITYVITVREAHKQPGRGQARLRLIPLDDTVVFPNMGITLTIDVGEDERVVLVPRHDNEFLEVGTIAEVSEQIRLPGGAPRWPCRRAPRPDRRSAVGPRRRASRRDRRAPDETPLTNARASLSASTAPPSRRSRAARDDGRIAAFLRAIAEPGALADSAGYSPRSPTTRRSSCCARST